jgi:hypothetical protein
MRWSETAMKSRQKLPRLFKLYTMARNLIGDSRIILDDYINYNEDCDKAKGKGI